MKKGEMTTSIGCLAVTMTIQGVIELIFLIAWLIWQNKITLFLLEVGAVLLVTLVIMWFVILHSIKKKIKNLFSQKKKD